MKELEKIGFLKFQPLGLRVWHWFNAAVISGLLLTVVLRRTLFNGRQNTDLIEKKMVEVGSPITHEAARKLSGMMIDRLWDWHVDLGYALAFLLLFRIAIGILYSESPLRWTWLGYRKFAAAEAAEKGSSLHFFAVRAGYLAFYASVVFMVASGLSMVYSDRLNLSRDAVHSIHEVHEAFQYFFFGFVVIHVVGVVIGELGRYKGIVSNMIHGGKFDRR